MSNREQGFTLVELMITLTVLAIVLAIAVPTFTTTMNSIRQRTQVNQLLADLHFARSRAITSRQPVSICAGASGCDGLARWSGQVVVFDDLNADGVLDELDTLLRTSAVASSHSWTWRNFRKQRHMTFKPDGTTHSLNGTFVLCRQDTKLKKIVINVTGRARLDAPTADDHCT
jgi:type IV fimbrial biogenesis protein FimT